MNIKTRKKGFTLIEMIVALAIASILSTVLYMFFYTNYKSLNKVETEVELQKNGEKAMKSIINNLMAAESIEEVPVKKPNNTYEMNIAHSNEYKALKFKALKVVNSTTNDSAHFNCTFNISNEYVKYNKQMYKLSYTQERSSKSETTDLCNDVEFFDVTVRDESNTTTTDISKAKSATVVLTLKKMKSLGGGGIIEKTFRSDIKFRNALDVPQTTP